MPWQTLSLVLAIHTVALISPGPDFAVVTRLSIVSGRAAGLWAAASIASAIGIYVLACVLGLSIVIAALPWLSRALGIAGALYLAWLGIQCLRSKGKLPEAQGEVQGGKAFTTGLFTNLLNPKAMFYFGSILSQALKPDLGATGSAQLWLLLVGESFLWFALVASLFSARQLLDWLRSHLVWFERFIGAVLIALAAKVAMSATR